MDEITITVEEYQTTGIVWASALAPPPFGVVATPVVGGGTFAAGNYFWEVTATTALGETTVSNEATAAIALNGSCTLTWNKPNATVTGYKVYRGTVSGAENVLVTTIVGQTTTFTDTNVGGAGAPPGTNTATIQDTVIYNGAGQFRGFSITETSGTAPAWVEFQDSATTLAEMRVAQGTSDTEGPFPTGVELYGRVNVHINAGAARGVVWVGIPC